MSIRSAVQSTARGSLVSPNRWQGPRMVQHRNLYLEPAHPDSLGGSLQSPMETRILKDLKTAHLYCNIPKHHQSNRMSRSSMFALHQTELDPSVCRDVGWGSRGRATPSGAAGHWWETACLRPLGSMPGRDKNEFRFCGTSFKLGWLKLVILLLFYRGSWNPRDGYFVDDHPVIVRQRGHVWVGSAGGVVIWLRREGFCHGF